MSRYEYVMHIAYVFIGMGIQHAATAVAVALGWEPTSYVLLAGALLCFVVAWLCRRHAARQAPTGRET